MSSVANVLAALLESRSALLADVEASLGTTERLLVRSDLTGTMQLYELGTNRELPQVTDLAEPVATAAYVPGKRAAVIASDQGGNERHQLYLVDLAAPARPPAWTASRPSRASLPSVTTSPGSARTAPFSPMCPTRPTASTSTSGS